MKKLILTTLLLSNYSLIWSQNFFQANNNQSQVYSGNGWGNGMFNESNNKDNRGNTNTNITRQSIQRNTGVVQTNRSNINNVVAQTGRAANQVQTNRAVTPNRGGNIAQTQRTEPINRGGRNINLTNVSDDNNNPVQLLNNDEAIIVLDNISNPILSRGNLNLNVENVQTKQVQFVASNDNNDVQMTLPQINFDFELNSTNKVKEVKVKNSSVEVAETKVAFEFPKFQPKVKVPKEVSLEKTADKKKRGNSHYTQENKNYTGKKIKIWCKKKLKIAKKIRMSVSCPTF